MPNSEISETITIPVKEYNELLQRSMILNCLEIAGVDNWDGYEFAIEEMEASHSDN